MKLTIPTDWEYPNDWECYVIWWPKSLQWRAVLTGLLTHPTRGRFWDERSGSIKSAQATAWEIVGRNFPLEHCKGGKEEVLEKSDALFASCEDSEGACDMTIAGPCPPLKIEGGRLFWWDQRCCQWFEIGDVGGVSPDDAPPDDAYEPDTQQFSACGKADRLVNAVYDVAQAVWDNRTSAVLWEFVADVEDQSRNHRLADGWLWLARLQAVELDIIYSEADIFDLRYKQEAKCRLAQLFGDDASDEMDKWDMIVRELAAAYPVVPPVALFYYNCLMAIGRQWAGRFVTTGASNLVADCDCQSAAIGPNPPSGLSWNYDFDFTQSANEFIASPGGWQWISGEGWGIPGTTPLDQDEIQVGRAVSGTPPKSFEVRYVWVEVGLPPQAAASGASSALDGLYWRSSGNVGQLFAAPETIRLDTDGRLSWSGSYAVTWASGAQDEQVRFALRLLRGPNVEDRFSPHMRLRRLFIAGSGVPPF